MKTEQIENHIKSIEKFTRTELSEFDLSNKKREKSLKQIYNLVHDKYFTKYSESCSFDSIFKNGTFNCLTASALYTKVFDYLSIPYSIQASNDHVYLIAYPEEEKIIIESTSPTRGVYNFTPEYKKFFIEFLVSEKTISKSELNEKGIDFLFQREYYKSEDINLRQLAGYHYHNKSIEQIRNDEYQEAYENSKKSLLLFKNIKTKSLFQEIALEKLNNNFDLNNPEDISLIKIIQQKSSNHDQIDEFIKYKYNKFLTDCEITGEFPENFSAITDSIELAIWDPINRKSFLELKFNYFLQYYLSAEKYNELIYTYLNFKCIFPKSKIIKSMDLFFQGVDFFRELTEKNVSLDSFQFAKNPSYSNCANASFISIFKKGLLLSYSSKFAIENSITKADSLLLIFEKTYSEIQDSTLDKQLIREAYLNNALYYYRNGKIDVSKKVAQRGLNFIPNDITLKNYSGEVDKGSKVQNLNTPSPYNQTKQYNNSPNRPRTIIIKK